MNKNYDGFMVNRVEVLSGEGSVIMVRGKVKIGYEFTLEIQLSSSLSSFSVKMIDVCDDDDDCQDY